MACIFPWVHHFRYFLFNTALKCYLPWARVYQKQPLYLQGRGKVYMHSTLSIPHLVGVALGMLLNLLLENPLFLVHILKFLCIAKLTISAAVNTVMILSILLTARKRLFMEFSMNWLWCSWCSENNAGDFEVKCECGVGWVSM